VFFEASPISGVSAVFSRKNIFCDRVNVKGLIGFAGENVNENDPLKNGFIAQPRRNDGDPRWQAAGYGAGSTD
jgi:hypothetical protein